MTEYSERYRRAWLEEFVRQDGARCLETSRLAASPVGGGRRGKGWPKEESSRVLGHQEKETGSEESKRSGTGRGEATVNGCQEKRSKEHLEVRGIGVIEDDGLRRQSPWKGDMHHLDVRCVESSRLAALGEGGSCARACRDTPLERGRETHWC
jgi:hypothetical protein